jgi:hypothetical protein
MGDGNHQMPCPCWINCNHGAGQAQKVLINRTVAGYSYHGAFQKKLFQAVQRGSTPQRIERHALNRYAGRQVHLTAYQCIKSTYR